MTSSNIVEKILLVEKFSKVKKSKNSHIKKILWAIWISKVRVHNAQKIFKSRKLRKM